MDFFIRTYTEKYVQIRKEEKEKIKDKLYFPFMMVFVFLVLSMIATFLSVRFERRNWLCVCIVLNFLLLIAISIISSKRDRNYFSNQTNLESSIKTLQRLQALLTENPYFKIQSKQDIQCLYKHVRNFYERKITSIGTVQKRALHIVDILIIPALFAVINFVLGTEEYTFESKFMFTIVFILFALEFLFFFYYIFQMIKTWVEVKNIKYEQFMNALNLLATMEVQDFYKNDRSITKNR